MAWTAPWNLLGLQLSGDVGDVTIYTDRFNRKVAYPKAPPKEPPSTAQVALRNKFRLAVLDWKSQTDQVKENYEDATKLTSIVMTGLNVWVSVALTHRVDLLRTLERQTGLTLPNPTLQ